MFLFIQKITVIEHFWDVMLKIEFSGLPRTSAPPDILIPYSQD